MDYSRVIAMINRLTEGISEVMNEGRRSLAPPPGDGSAEQQTIERGD